MLINLDIWLNRTTVCGLIDKGIHTNSIILKILDEMSCYYCNTVFIKSIVWYANTDETGY